MHIRKDNTSNSWRSAKGALLLFILSLSITLSSCFSPRTNPLDPENPNATEQFGVSLDYRSHIDPDGSETLVFTVSAETQGPRFIIWRIYQDDHTRVDTTESITHSEDLTGEWSKLEVEVEVINVRGARGRGTALVPPRWCHYDTTNGFPTTKGSSLEIPSIRCMALDSTGVLWIGGRELELWSFRDEQFRKEYPIQEMTGQLFGSVFSILVDPLDNLWVGTKARGDAQKGGGLWFDKSGVWQNLNENNGDLKIGSVEGVFFDSRENLWVITDVLSGQHMLLWEEGLGKSDPVAVDPDSAFRVQEGIDHLPTVGDVRTGLAGDGRLVWFGAGVKGGLLRFDLDSGRWDKLDIEGQAVGSLVFGSNQRIWVGTEGRGLHVVPVTTDTILATYKEPEIPSNDITSLASAGPDSEIIWVGTQKGLARFDGSRMESIPIPGTAPGGPWIESLVVDERNGVLWIGTYDSGLFCHRFK